jgi:hypothetical protein
VDRTLILLLVALALVYFAWRAAQRQTQRALAARAAEQERNTFTLEPYEDAAERGYVVVTATGERPEPAALSWADDGLEVLAVAGFRAGSDAGSSTAFEPGSAVELIPPVDAVDDQRIEVWNSDMTVRAGTLAAADSARLLTRGDDAAAGACLVLRETLTRGERSGLLLLLVRHDMLLDA